MLFTSYPHIGVTSVDLYQTLGKSRPEPRAMIWYKHETDLDSPYQPLAQDEMPTRRSLSTTRSTSWISTEDEPHILTDPRALPDQEDKLGVRETAGVAVWWGIVWYIGNWLNNTALGMTSVASMTIIATTSGT